jgi:adenylate cyclase
VLFLAVVIPLAASGISEAWFGYRDQQARLDQLLGVETRGAAAKIQGFLDEITNQLGWLVQLPWSDTCTTPTTYWLTFTTCCR